ncbi:plasmid pRiA4b ORF-3 family protein [Marinimicrobium sp. C2-29]|uniref:plasmid pRiA4b ORF-3 family protein n=1 Tax=Marinimicrobium sp. C2-29 TaxID=3139825 RepID=UPI003139787E
MALAKPRFYQIRVTLLDVDPPIWRRLTLSSETTLGQLHGILQVAMGWFDRHLHLFKADNGALYGPADVDDDLMKVKDEDSVTLGRVLRKPKQTLRYEYDFGDGWAHEILLEKSLPLVGDAPVPSCEKAVGACPPEDVGGPPGYARLLEILRDPKHPDYASMLEWLGGEPLDPTFVDLDEVNGILSDFDREDRDESVLEDLIDDIRETLSAQGIDSEEAVTEAVREIMEQQQRQPLFDDFHGLSPERTHSLLYETLDAPWITWSYRSPYIEGTPIIRLLKPLVAELAERDIKLTPKGNLPLAMVKQMMTGVELAHDPLSHLRGSVRSEEDINPVHIARILAQLAGLFDLKKTKMSLNKKWQRELEKSGWDPLYGALFQCMLRDFNWSYVAGQEEATGIQTTGPFLLWLLHLYGDQWRPSSFYEEAQLQAFPVLLEEVEATPYRKMGEAVKELILLRPLPLFEWFGLIEMRPLPDASEPTFRSHYELKATPLLENMIDWS